jgi:hypothetical protein
VRYPDGSDAIGFFQIKTDEGFCGFTLPAWVPGKFEQLRPLDSRVFAVTDECIPPRNASHDPLPTRPQVGLHFVGLVRTFCAPPFEPLLRIGNRFENAVGRSFDRNLFDDRFVSRGWVHDFSFFWFAGSST